MSANLELKAERIRRGKTVPYMCSLLGISQSSYYSREKGNTKFSKEEICLIADDFEMNAGDLNRIFYDGKLPINQSENTE